MAVPPTDGRMASSSNVRCGGAGMICESEIRRTASMCLVLQQHLSQPCATSRELRLRSKLRYG